MPGSVRCTCESSLAYWLVINPVPWPPCCPVTLSAVHGDHLVTPDGHAEVHRRRLQRGLAGREETLLFPGGQTLHVLLSDQQLPREGKRGQRWAVLRNQDSLPSGVCCQTTCSLPSPSFSGVFQARETLSTKLPIWQEKCSDITKVPDTVETMIEGLSPTPVQSPLVEHNNRVRVETGIQFVPPLWDKHYL